LNPGAGWTAVDVESTGLDPAIDRIVEVAAVRCDASGREIDAFASLVRPGREIPPTASALHKLDSAALRDAPEESAVMGRLLDWLGPAGASRLIAHKARFEATFLRAALTRSELDGSGHVIVDTLAVTRRWLPESRRHGLADLARRLGLPGGEEHRALPDARRLAGMWRALRERGFPTDDPSLPAYRIADPRAAGGVLPVGWEWLVAAIEAGLTVAILHSGGSKGRAPRLIGPRGVVEMGGREYVVAFCEIDRKEKRFRLDRIAPAEAAGLESPPGRR
jgi:DNA polymerase III epsilon subunit-like protein